jgi:PAS domain S-box-containing protein
MTPDTKQLYTLPHSIGGVFWEASPDMRRFFVAGDHLTTVLGENPADWLNQDDCWTACTHPNDREISKVYEQLGQNGGGHEVLTYRMIHRDGRIVWIRDTVSAIRLTDGSTVLRGFMMDVSLSGRLQALEQLERKVLQLNADLSLPLREVLTIYLEGLESLFPQMHCSIHRIRHQRLETAIAPSLPPGYVAAITGLAIGENEGSCGSAAALKRQIIVSDIAVDARWLKYRDAALAHGLRACWSNPVISNGEVMATLAMYYTEARIPGPGEKSVMEKATVLLHVILEYRQQMELTRENNLLMLQSQELARFGTWRWEIPHDVVTWSPALFEIYGFDSKDFKATFKGYTDLLHPGDRERIEQIIGNVIQTGAEASFEERIIRPGGQTRYLRSWAKLKQDGQGQPIEMIGACLDITESVLQRQAIEEQNLRLLDIAWAQSHMIRAPLARIMSLIELLKDGDEGLTTESRQLLHYLNVSASELDDQVQSISRKTETLDQPGIN